MPPPATAAATAQVSAVPAHAGIAGDSVEEVPAAALVERLVILTYLWIRGANRSGTSEVGVTPAPDSVAFGSSRHVCSSTVVLA